MECVVKGSPETIVESAIIGSSQKKMRHGGETLLGYVSETSFEVFSEEDGEYKETGEFLLEGSYDCDSPGKSADFPIVITDQDQLKELGIATDFLASDENQLTLFPNQCFQVGSGHDHFSLSDAFVERHARRGISFDNLCLALGAGQIRFNPETGERLPTFVLLQEWDGLWLSTFEYLLDVPSCFGGGITKIWQDANNARLRPIGCELKFHPWSGRPMSAEETAFFNSRAFLVIYGDAGGSTMDGNDLAADSNRRATAAKIEALKLMLAE
jgi:hypothetical protein